MRCSTASGFVAAEAATAAGDGAGVLKVNRYGVAVDGILLQLLLCQLPLLRFRPGL